MGDRPSGLFFDPNTGDDMVDKNDLFPEEDGINPQDQDREELSSDEDDDIIELLDTVEIPAENIEEEIIELEDMVEVSDDGIIELTEEAQESLADEDVLELTEVVTDEDELEDDVLELTDIVAADDAEADGALDLTQKAESSDIDDDIIDLTEPVTEDEVFELVDTVEVPFKEMVEDSVEPADFPWGLTLTPLMTLVDQTEHLAEDEVADFLDTIEIPAQDTGEDNVETADTFLEPDADTGDDVIDLTEPMAKDEGMGLLDTVEIPAQDMEEDSIEAADTAQELDLDTGDDIFDAAEAVDDFDIDEADMDLTETVEDMETDQEERFQETVALPSAGYEEDKELLELIDDIQATLNDEPVAERASDQEGTPQADESIEADALDNDADAYTFLDNDEFIEEGEVPESETEFVDHLGIDLTSEIERETLEKSQEAVSEDVIPTENLASGIAPGVLETAVKQALTEMLAEENNPLAKAIENAVKKALGQGTDT